MHISIGSEFEAFIREQIKRGHHASADEVVQEGLRLLQSREQARERLRKEVAVGIEQLEQGEFEEHDDESLCAFFEAIKEEARKRLVGQPASEGP